MNYERLNIQNGIDKWDVAKVRHLEEGIIANEEAINSANYATQQDVEEAIANINKWTLIDTLDLSEAIGYIIDTSNYNKIAIVNKTALEATGMRIAWKNVGLSGVSTAKSAVFTFDYLGNGTIIAQRWRASDDNSQIANCATTAIDNDTELKINFDTVTAGTIMIFGG